MQYQIVLLVKRKTHNGRRKLVMIREHGPFCGRCHKWTELDDLTIDHIICQKMGLPGGHYQAPENRQLLCTTCHRMKYVLEHWFKNRIGSRKAKYLLLLIN